MLGFATKPDPVFQEIIHETLEFTRDIIVDLDRDSLDSDSPDWRAMFPELAGLFTRRTAVDVIERLLIANRESTVYRLTAYHWLVLYVFLRFYCDSHEDLALEQPSGTWPVGPYEIGTIDFERLVDRFFWDTDFAFEQDVVIGLGPEGRRMADIADEVFGIAQGLPPHPHELRLTPWEAPDWEVLAEPIPPLWTRLERYPPED